MDTENQTEIQLRLSTKGKYHWSIKHGIPTKLFRQVSNVDDTQKLVHLLVEEVRQIDERLREIFPKNTTSTSVNAGKYFVDEDEF